MSSGRRRRERRHWVDGSSRASASIAIRRHRGRRLCLARTCCGFELTPQFGSLIAGTALALERPREFGTGLLQLCLRGLDRGFGLGESRLQFFVLVAHSMRLGFGAVSDLREPCCFFLENGDLRLGLGKRLLQSVDAAATLGF